MKKPVITVKLDEKLFDKFQKNLDNEITTMIGEIGTAVQNSVRAEISKAGLVDTANYIRSVQLDIKRNNKAAMAVVGTNALYALPIEYGMKKTFYPSKDMIQAISLWAQRKLHLSAGEAKKAAGGIAWSIARKGASLGFPRRFGKDGARVFEKGFSNVVKRVPSIVERFVRRASALTEPTV